MNDYLVAIVPWIWKFILIVVGVVFSLILSGDIDKNGKCNITISLLSKFSFGFVFSLVGGEAYIVHRNLQDVGIMYQGFIMLMFAVFGLLIIGIVYQSIKMLDGKSLSEVVSEIKDTFISILK